MFKKYLFFITVTCPVFLSCSKEYSVSSKPTLVNCKPVPLLTQKVWVGDTMFVDPPYTYSQLLPDILWYSAELTSLKTHQLTFNNTCQCIQTSNSWYGFNGKWSLINNDKDIKIDSFYNSNNIFYNWKADSIRLTFSRKFTTVASNSPSPINFSITYVYK